MAELLCAAANQPEPHTTGLTLRLEDIARYSRQTSAAQMMLRGQVVEPLPARGAAQCPQDYWLCCGIDGGEIRLGCGDRMHVNAEGSELTDVHVLGCCQGDASSQVIVHGDAAILRNVRLHGCELHILGSATRLEHCRVTGAQQQAVGICIRRALPEAPAPRSVLLSTCKVSDVCVALEVQHAHRLKIVDCECALSLEPVMGSLHLATHQASLLCARTCAFSCEGRVFAHQHVCCKSVCESCAPPRQ